jgi:hypothetical protein
MPHICHWPGCAVEVRPTLFCCKRHWFALPRSIRQAIWQTYRKGQEIDKNPSPEYLAAARTALDWAREHPRDTTTWGAAAR